MVVKVVRVLKKLRCHIGDGWTYIKVKVGHYSAFGQNSQLQVPNTDRKFLDARRGRWRFVLKIFLLVKGNHLAVLLVTAVVTVLKELLERRTERVQKRINLNVVASALHPNTLAAPAGELVRQTGAQLQLDIGGLSQVAGVVARAPPMHPHRQHVPLLHGEPEVRVVLVLQLPLLVVLVKGKQPAGGSSVLPWVTSTDV